MIRKLQTTHLLQGDYLGSNYQGLTFDLLGNSM